MSLITGLIRYIVLAVLWVLFAVLLLGAGSLLLLRIPAVQRKAATEVSQILSKTLHATVRLHTIEAGFPRLLRVNGLFISGAGKDTLVSAGSLSTDIDILPLFSKRIQLSRVTVDNGVVRLARRGTDSLFNYQALSGSSRKKNPRPVPTETPRRSDPWQIVITSFNLTRSDVAYIDDPSGISVTIHAGTVSAASDGPLGETLSLESAAVSNGTVSVEMKSPTRHTKDTTGGSAFRLRIGKSELSNVLVKYSDESGSAYAFRTGSAHNGLLSLDVHGMELVSADISDCDARLKQVARKDTVSTTESSGGASFTVGLQQVRLRRGAFQYADGTPAFSRGFDAHNMQFSQLFAEVNSFAYRNGTVTGDLKSARVKERSGLDVAHASGRFYYNADSLSVYGSDVRTKRSGINGSFAISSKEGINAAPERLNIFVDVARSTVSTDDVLLFAPALDSVLRSGASVYADARMEGNANEIRVQHAVLRSGGVSAELIDSYARSLSDPANLFVSAASFSVHYVKAPPSAFLHLSALSNQMVADSLDVSGSAEGYMRNFNAVISASGVAGELQAKVLMDPAKGNVEVPYNVQLNTVGFSPGKLIAVKSLPHNITLTASLTGTGFSTATAVADATVNCRSIGLSDVMLHSLFFRGHYRERSVSADLSLRDSLLAFDLAGHADLDTLSADARFRLYGGDFGALHLYKGDLRIASGGKLKVITDPDNFMCGQVEIRNIHIYQEDKHHVIDSVILISRKDSTHNLIALQSDMLQVILTGKFKPALLVKETRRVLAVHTGFALRKDMKDSIPQEAELGVELNDPSLLMSGIIPGLTSISPFTINGRLDSRDNVLQMKVRVPQLIWSGIVLDSLNADVLTPGGKMQAEIRIGQLSNPVFKTENVRFKGIMKEGVADLSLLLKEDNNLRLFDGGAFLTASSAGWNLRMKPDLVLNDQSWKIHPENVLSVSPAGVSVHHMVLTNGSSTVAAEGSSLVAVTFHSFNAGTLSRIIENKKQLFDGVLDGRIEVSTTGPFTANGNLTLHGTVFRETALGDFTVSARQNGDDACAIHVLQNGAGNDLELTAGWKIREKQVSGKLDIRHLELRSVEPFTFGQLSRMQGYAQGQVSFAYSRKVSADGAIRIKDAAMHAKYLDNYFLVKDASLTLKNEKLHFDRFTVTDSLGHEATVTGNVGITPGTELPVNLRIKSANFLALHTTKKDNPLYYGTVFIDSDIRAGGTLLKLKLDVTGSVNKGSDITYVRRQDTEVRDAGKGIVEFVDTSSAPNFIIKRRSDSLQPGVYRGVDLHARVSINRDVKIRVIIDPVAGDSLFVTGDGVLDLTYNADGSSALTGRYRVNDGGYYLTISNIIKRSFRITKGSVITWSGDMLDPFVDLKAVYRIKASPMDLVQDEVSGMTAVERNKYRNLLSFDVFLKMNGFISSPDISFDIRLAPEDRGALNGVVNARLIQLSADESQLNKQVFALLTLKRFVGDNPLESSAGGGIAAASRSSASQLLTQQLNALSGRYVNFVDLDLGVNSFEDYSSGREEGRTQLQVGVSKQLWDDRVTIRVGGNVELEGERARQNNANDVAGNISIDYNLTDDGRYKARAFRENQYENPIEGELTKTGAGVIFTRNFNRFRELFTKPKRKRSRTKQDEN